nr:MAG TPA: capsid fiber protein [Caudoviricetes sp.]
MAITAFKDVFRQVDNVMHYKLKANEVIPEGALVAIDSNGLAINAVATSKVVGVATGVIQDGRVEVYTGGIIDVKYNGTATQAKVGELVTTVDNETVKTAATGNPIAGVVVEFKSATQVRIRILTDGRTA